MHTFSAGFSATTPADGTLVGDRTGDAVYVAAGGALFPFTRQADLSSSAYAGTNIILEPSNQIAAQESAKPADGTLLKDATTGAIFVVSGGTLVPLAPTQFVLPTITVPSQSLDGYPIASGDFFTIAGGDGTVYESVGGAAVPVTDWSHVGGPQPTGTLSQAQFDSMAPVPPDGTFVKATVPGTSTTNNYEFAGGAPIFVSDFSHVGGPPTTAPIAIDQTAIDDAGTGGAFNHIRSTPADGTYVTATPPGSSTANAYVFAAGAPIYISDWSHVGGQPTGPIAAIDQTALDNAGSGGVFNHMRAQPADQTLIESFGTGHIFVIAGGAPLEVSSLANIGSPTQTPTFVDQVALDKAGTGGFYNHLNFRPTDNTLIAGNGTNYFVVAGGAPIYVPYLEDIGGARGFVTVDESAIDKAGTGGDWNHLAAMPVNGTIVESFNTGKVYQIIAGVPTLDCSASQTFLYIDQVALDKAGTGGFYNHLKKLPSPPPAPCPTPTPTDPGPQL